MADDPWCRRAAALLALGDAAALSHATAAEVHGLALPVAAGACAIHVVVPPPTRPHQRPGIQVHLPRRLAEAQVTGRRGFRVTTLERTVVDLSALLTSTESLALVAHVLQRRLSTPARLGAVVLAAGPTRGAGRVAHLLREVDGGQQSVLEVVFSRLVRRSGLPTPCWQVPVPTPRGVRRLDALWPQAGFAVELDGRAFHLSPAAWEDGLVRDSDLAAVGIEVMHVSWRQVSDHGADVVERIRAALRRRAQVQQAVPPPYAGLVEEVPLRAGRSSTNRGR